MLQLKQLQIGYQKALLKEPIQYTFSEGELVTLLGRNGCGKTTLLNILAGQQKPLGGEVLLSKKNKNIHHLSVTELAQHVSIATTERLQIPYLKILDLVAFGFFPHQQHFGFGRKARLVQEQNKERAQEALKNLQMEHIAQQYWDNCSDGERQMAMLARILAQDTPLIVLDEITAHLDFVHRNLILRQLRRLAEAFQKIIFIATHEVNLALKYAHRLVLFHDNKIQITTPQSELTTNLLQQIFYQYLK